VIINIEKRNLVSIFTKDEEIIELTASVLSVAFVGTLADLWHGYTAGVIRALGL
jgi:Na+-driven multidrug efflux pump